MPPDLDGLASRVRDCSLCAEQLPLGPRPIIQVHADARILIAGQAPGARVHESGIPFDDPSGVRLREWMGVDEAMFYDASKIAILPMGFCYPGKGKSGDLPPIKRCAATWRRELLDAMSSIRLTLVIGRYAIDWHLNESRKNATDVIRDWQAYGSAVMPLPHPSPRNNIWLKKNAWFEAEVLPQLRRKVSKALS
ncbi:MAG: uracil-DNA glycosylase family protein [Woeseiaceae bacterium]